MVRVAPPWVLLGALASCGIAAGAVGSNRQGLTDAAADPGHPSVGLLETVQTGAVDYCTATLVGQKTIVTAAHCLTQAGSRTVRLEDQVFSVVRVLVHPDWDPDDPKFPNDLGLVQLAAAPAIVPSRLYAGAPQVGLPVTLVGFGATQSGADDFGVKRIALNSIDALSDKRIVVVGSGEGEGNTCEGDSGGPVFARLAGQEVLLAVNSAGQPPCGTNGVSTRIDAYLPWLEQSAGDDLDFADDLPADAVCVAVGHCDRGLSGGCALGRPQGKGGTGLLLLFLLVLWRARTRAVGRCQAPQ